MKVTRIYFKAPSLPATADIELLSLSIEHGWELTRLSDGSWECKHAGGCTTIPAADVLTFCVGAS